MDRQIRYVVDPFRTLYMHLVILSDLVNSRFKGSFLLVVTPGPAGRFSYLNSQVLEIFSDDDRLPLNHIRLPFFFYL